MSPGFTMIDNDAVVDRLPDIDGSTFKVYAVLARRADAAGRCYPSIKSLAADTGLKARTVQNAVYRAIKLGLLRAHRQKGCVTTYLLTHATTCATPEEGNATGCAGVTQQDARGNATTCATPTQQDAHGTIPKNNTQEQDPMNKTSRGRAAVVVEIPGELDSDVFREAWGRWTAHRKEIKKALTPSTTAAQLKKLSAIGEVRAVAAINHSIEAGWTGIFEERNGHARKTGFPLGSGQRHARDTAGSGVF